VGISNQFHLHPKVIQARRIEPGSIGLWLLAHCWCRAHRGKGVIPKTQAKELGSQSEIQTLVDVGLWVEQDDAYLFHDWDGWNPEDTRNGAVSSAQWIVQEALPDHPSQIHARLAVEVRSLIEDGIAKPHIVSALQKWGQTANARPSWLPYLVSDAIKAGETGVHAAIKQARKTGNMSPLKEFGFSWYAPDVPDGMRSPTKVRAWMREQKMLWLDDVEARVGESTAG